MFITFEGGDGTGKTTLIENIYNHFKTTHDIIKTREPGGSMITEAIRDIILNPKYTGVTPYTEALLLAASRAQHLDEVILPNLKANKIVLCDRFLDSSLAYQGYARKLGYDFILKINHYATINLPDLTFYIDLDPSVGINRIKDRDKYDRLDRESNTFHQRVREGYLEVVKQYPNRIIVIDGSQSLEAITKEMIEIIKERL